jgi:lactoylglutathione lyase
MAKLIHTMIRVLDEQRSLDFYKTALGLDVAGRYPFDGFTLVYLRNAENEVELELTINEGRTEPYTFGDGYGHIAVTAPDLDAERERLLAAGIEAGPIKQFERDGALMARFFFIQDPDGYKIEVLQHHGRYV